MIKKNSKPRVLIVFGTRPEGIKMAPLVKTFTDSDDFVTKVCITAQHREMLDQVLDFFKITPDYDFDLMKPNQSLYSLTAAIISSLQEILEEFAPQYVFVHGDTTTTMGASIASFYSGAKVCHIEAGLRTNNKLSPFPEEINRQITSRIADFHFAPTRVSMENLIKENIPKETIEVTGNTVIDALKSSLELLQQYESEDLTAVKRLVNTDKRIVLVTGHRRENQDGGFKRICKALKRIGEEMEDVDIIYPVHLNPKVKDVVFEELGDAKNIKLIEPLSYPCFVWLMNASYLILTDSGGIQEEAPSLGKPVLVMRDTTERPEAVDAGTVILVGTEEKRIYEEVMSLLSDKDRYEKMSKHHNPYGDGEACTKIIERLKKERIQ